MIEFTTPMPITIGQMRFVFYFTPQLVADTFDNIPQIYLDVMEKKAPDNQQRLYVCCKPIPELMPSVVDVSEASLVIAEELNLYLKKHFGSKVSVLETMPMGLLDRAVVSMVTIIHYLLASQGDLGRGYEVDYFVASALQNGCSLVKIAPSLLMRYVFIFTTDETSLPDNVSLFCSGNALLWGEPMVFSIIDTRPIPYRGLDVETVMQFVGPSLIEDTINRAIRKSIGHPAVESDVYLVEVEIEKA